MNDFKNKYWKKICKRALEEYTYLTYDQFLKAYNQSHRRFHTIEHLEYILDYIAVAENFYLNSDVIILTTIFHDIVYYPHFTNNEYRSVKMLRQHWKYDGDEELLKEVTTCIFDTRERKDPNLYCEIFNKADTSILYSKEPRELISYEQNIRKEFDFLELSIYKEKRLEFLKKIINDENRASIHVIIEYINIPENFSVTEEENDAEENLLGFDE